MDSAKSAAKLEEMNWPDIKALLNRTNIAIVPVGSLEQHGPHLPINTDTVIACEVAKRAVQRVGVAVSPPISFGFSVEHQNYPGTISLSAESFMNVVQDVCKSLVYHGFRKIVLLNAHGGNTGILTAILQSIRSEYNVTVSLVSIWGLAKDEFDRIRESEPVPIAHGEECETSLMLAIDPAKVDLERMKRTKPRPRLGASMLHYKIGVRAGWRTEDISESGVIGDPTKATREKGERLLAAITEKLVNYLEKLEKTTPP